MSRFGNWGLAGSRSSWTLLWALLGLPGSCGLFLGPLCSVVNLGPPDRQFGPARLSVKTATQIVNLGPVDCQDRQFPPPPPRWSNNGPQIVNLCPPDCRFGPTRLRHQIVNLSHEPPHCQFGPAEPASFPNIIPVAKPMYLNAIFACLRSRHAAKQNTTWAAPGGFRLLDFVVFCACAGCPFGLFSGILPGPKCGCLAFSGVRGLNIGFRVLGFEGLGLCDL